MEHKKSQNKILIIYSNFYSEIANNLLDGASKFLILHKLIIPLSLGGLSVTFIFSIMLFDIRIQDLNIILSNSN